MTDGWVKVWDQSFQRVPASRLHEMYAAGYRVMAGYAGGGSSTKWLTAHEIAVWFACGPDTGVAALFEVKGTEPIDSPTLGDDHAKEARAAWRALGYPDGCAISPAVDRNVTVPQARAQLTTYFSHWAVADTFHPLAYVEMDAGAVLFAEGVSCGTFTPAAFSWDASDKLVTPDNAPSHVLWTQEHNAQKIAGGTVDIGHIRTTAPIQWKAGAMAELTQQQVVQAVWSLDPPKGAGVGDVIPNNSQYVADSPAHTPPGTNATTGAGYALGRIRTLAEAVPHQLDGLRSAIDKVQAPVAQVDVPALATALAPLVAEEILKQLNLVQKQD